MGMTWSEGDGGLEREFVFANFVSALKFLNRVGDVAEKMQHHPDMFLYNYNQVRVSLSTHDQNRITQKDYLLAEKIDDILKDS